MPDFKTIVLLKALLFLAIGFMVLPVRAAVVLEYHHVSDKTPKSTSITPERFNAQMDYLAANGFNVVPLMELVDALRQGDPLPDKTVAITFDDSYASVYQSAYPLLKKRGWPFTFFVNTTSVGQSSLFVSWDQLREMSKNGVTIANHTTEHNHLVRLLPDESRIQWRVRIAQEINQAQKKITEEIGSAPMVMAYPFGEYDVHVQDIAKKLGYVAFGQQSGALYSGGDLQAVPRFPFGGSFTELDDFILKVNSLPMPIKSIQFYTDKKTPRNNLIIAEGSKPWLVMELTDAQLLKKVNCFATGQGAIKTETVGEQLWVQAAQPLKQGRTRYNCTALSNQKGRFYWYTQQWLVTNKKGDWTYKD